MSVWTRRDLVKAGVAAGAAGLVSGRVLGEPMGQASPVGAGAAAETNAMRERLLMDFGFGKLRREGTFA